MDSKPANELNIEELLEAMPQQLYVNSYVPVICDEVEQQAIPDHMERYPLMYIEDVLFQSFESIHVLDGTVDAAQPILA